MKKKLLCALMLFSVTGINISSAQQFIRNYTITTTGVSQDLPVDVNYHRSQDTYFSLHYSSNGNMPVLMYDGTTYASLGGANLFKSGVNYSPQAINHYTNYTAVLFNVPTANASYGICLYNHLTNVISWVKNFSYPNTAYAITAKDMVLDDANKQLYVVADIVDNSSGRVGIYIAKIDLGTGVPGWTKMIMNGVYDFSTNNIFFSSVSDIYVAAGASDPTSILNRGAYVVDVNSGGTQVASTFIKYDSSCTPHRMTSPSVKRLNSDVYVFCPSVVGPDGSGNYFLAEFNSTLTTISNYHIYFAGSLYFNNFVAPKFEFVNNDQNIMVSGIRSLLNSATAGYLHTIYDLNTSFVSGINYQNENVNIYGDPIIDCYNGNTNQVFTVAENRVTPSIYYGFRSSPNGDISKDCDTVYYQDSTYCKLLTPGLDVNGSFLHYAYADIKTFKISPIAQGYEVTCESDSCADCGIIPYQPGNTRSITNNADREDAWNVYPNPASAVLEITCSSDIKTIVITNIKGEKVKTFINVNALRMSIDINELPKGMYFINAISSDQRSINKKFIKE